jgi:hypothetical protein
VRLPALTIAAFAALSLLISGCDLLYSYLDPFGLPPGGFGPPGATTQFLNGTATVEITQGGQTQTLILDGISADSYLDAEYGATVTWQDLDGWSVMVSAYDNSFMPGVAVPGWYGDVTINRVDGSTYWTAGSYTDFSAGGCIVNVWELTATKLTGRANCTTLRWADGMNMAFDASAYVEGEDDFDVTIDFEVEVSSDAPGQTS